MRSEIQAAVVGAGYWGANLIRILQHTDGIWLKLVCDAQPHVVQDVKAASPQLALTSSYDDILRDPNIDAVFLATPPSTHYQLAHAALNAGKHVWVEKPLALAHQEGRELVALARQTQRKLFVDETFLYDPLLERARDIVRNDGLGEVFHVSLERTGLGRIRRDSNVWWNSAPHDLSIVHYLFDTSIVRVSATGHAFLQPAIEDVVWASLHLAGGISAHVYLSWLSPEKKASLMIVGKSGMLSYEGRFGKRQLTRYAYRLGLSTDSSLGETPGVNLIPIEQSDIVEIIPGDRTEPLMRACAGFRDSIVTGRAAPSSGEYSLRTVAALEAGARSLTRQGCWETVFGVDND
jgi:predicted dehydrogenase